LSDEGNQTNNGVILDQCF